MEYLRNFIKTLKTRGLEALGRYYSTYPAFVYDRKDPEYRGRLRLVIPMLTRDRPSNTWALPKTFSGNGYGAQTIPKSGDLVWVSFRHGDRRYPIWEYGYFGNKEPEDSTLSRYDNHWFKTPAGSMVEIDDTKGEEEIRVTHRSGAKLIFSNEGLLVETLGSVDVVAGTSSISIDSSNINIDANGAPVFVNGPHEVLYSTIPGATAITNVAQIGVSKTVKVGP
tara:strand:+ start:25838 stop:26506 length:669 start_codon:yes stop_codon:yes gene_type:complete